MVKSQKLSLHWYIVHVCKSSVFDRQTQFSLSSADSDQELDTTGTGMIQLNRASIARVVRPKLGHFFFLRDIKRT
jgi:hypothetical protein